MHPAPQVAWPTVGLAVPGFDIVTGVHPPASVLARHTHDRPTICAVRSGSFTEYYAGKAVECDERTVKLTPAGEPHWNRFAAVETQGVRIDVDSTRFHDRPSVMRMLDERVFFPSGAFTGLADAVARELSRNDAASPVAVEALLLDLVARMARLVDVRPTVLPRWLDRADALIHESFRTRLTVAGIAGEVGVHATTLTRAYRRRYQCTIATRIRQLRLDWAARELAASETRLSDVALQAGFYDQSHFSNEFRRQFGVSPGRFRREASITRRSRPHA
jgi:AraC family transcriptional regulator